MKHHAPTRLHRRRIPLRLTATMRVSPNKHFPEITARGDERIKGAAEHSEKLADRAHADAERIIALLYEIKQNLERR